MNKSTAQSVKQLLHKAAHRQTDPAICILPLPHPSATFPSGGSFFVVFPHLPPPASHPFCKKYTGGEKPVPPFCYRNTARGAQPALTLRKDDA